MQKKLVVLATSAVIAATAVSNAQAQGFYVFAEGAHNDIASSEAEGLINEIDRLGSAGTEAMNGLLDSTPGYVGDLEYSSSFSSDDTDTTLGLGVGYRFHKHFAAEFAYRDLGDASYASSYQITGTDANGAGHRELTYESKAFILRGVGILPVTDRFSLEAMLGVAYVDTDYRFSDVGTGEGLLINYSEHESESGSDFSATYGVGASFDISDSVTGYARWERVHDIDTENVADGRVEADTFSAGIRYHF